jgi:hypothetical protein
MSEHRNLKVSYALAALLLCTAGHRALAQQEAQTTPSIVFVGTVETTQAVALQNLKASPNTSVVVVEKVLRKPDAITLVPGDEVTVLTDGNSNPLKGARALFYADGWIFGEGLAVKVRSWEPASAPVVAASSGEDVKMATHMQALADQDTQALLADTDVVVVGRVKRIQAPSVAGLVPARPVVSEHDPEWKEAVVEVQSALKGAAGVSEIVVRFPASMDVAWAGYPKFQEGQEGTFLLQRDRISPSSHAVLDGRSVTAYIAPGFKNVLSSGDSARIKVLLER